MQGRHPILNSYLLVCLLLSVALLKTTFTHAQENSATIIADLQQKIANSPKDTNRLNLLLQLSKYYVNRMDNLDSSLHYADKALDLSYELPSHRHTNIALLLKGRLLLRKLRIQAALATLEPLFAEARRNGDKLQEAKLYFDIGKQISTAYPENIPLKLEYFEKSSALYLQLKRPDLEKTVRNYIGRVYLEQGKIDVAEKIYQQQLQDAIKRGEKDYQLIYLGLSEIAEAKADLGKQLYYNLELLKIANEPPVTFSKLEWKGYLLTKLADVYSSLNRHDEAKHALEEGLAVCLQRKDYDAYYLYCQMLGNVLFTLHRYQEAIDFANTTLRNYPPSNDYQRLLINGVLGRAYLKTGQPDKAEPYYMAMDKSAQSITDLSRFSTIVDSYLGAHYNNMIYFYYTTGRYNKALEYVARFNSMNKHPMMINHRIYNMWLQTQLDSARGDYFSAYRHLMEYRNMNDSVNNNKNKQAMADLMIKYETEKKDQDLLLQRQRITLLQKQQEIKEGLLAKAGLQLQLARQIREKEAYDAERREKELKYAAERKDNRINLLNKQSQIQAAKLENEKLLRNTSLLGLLLTCIIIGLLYYSYRVKKQNNLQLTLQKNEIDLQNQRLSRLVAEKEWLLKELHHRVKNNLQIVISLLNIQSYYLEDKAAIRAIRDTQQRVHSMSLIHKKLYLSEQVNMIYMPDYLAELVNDLKESFGVSHKIRFDVQVEELLMDATQAVPLGLIINEAVTNCVKYAFPDNQPGTVLVQMRKTGGDTLRVTIADNGVGLPADVSAGFENSLGMNIIQGLSGDLDGRCKIETASGTSITVEFPHSSDTKKSGLRPDFQQTNNI